MDMDNLSPPETRRRSRSRTPFLRSSCDRELCAHAGEGHVHHDRKKSPLKKSPRVQTIIEESIDQLPDSRKVHKTKKVVTRTSDYSSEETSPEQARVQTSGRTVTISSTVSGSIQTVTSQVNTSTNKESSQLSLSNIASPIFEGGAKGFFSKVKSMVRSNSRSEGFEAIQTSTPIAMGQTEKLSEIRSNGKAEEHISYKMYKEAGEYWNKYPKTDYTYSRLSPHRRELAPGIVAMPNISRQSLLKHHERVNLMAERNPEMETYIRNRYEANLSYSPPKAYKSEACYYDSQDEVDLTEQNYVKKVSRNHNYKANYEAHTESVFTRFFTSIVTVLTRVTTIFSYEQKNEQLGLVNARQGFLRRSISSIIYSFGYVARQVYLLISSILYLDSLLLMSSSVNSTSRKRFLLFLLLLVPLSLIGARFLLYDNDNTIMPTLQAYNDNTIMPTLQAIVPAVIGIQTILKESWNKVNNFDYYSLMPSAEWLPLPAHNKYESESNRFAQTLDPDAIASIRSHIDAYIEKLVDEKVSKEREESIRREEKIAHEINLQIAGTLREQIISLIPSIPWPTKHYEFSEDDVKRMAETIRIQLANSEEPFAKFSLTQSNIEEISNLIKFNVDEKFNKVNIINKIDIDELLFRILNSPDLIAHIKIQVAESSKETVPDIMKLTINELNQEIALIKTELASKLSEIDDLKVSIDVLKENQDQIVRKFSDLENSSKADFANLLLEIDNRLSTMQEDQFKSINKQVKLALIEILGYKNGKNIEAIDIQNWIRNMFVAKEFLETRLLEISKSIDSKMKEEIDRSGMILMKDITNKVKEQTLLLIDDKKREFTTTNVEVGTSLSEVRVKEIVRDALMVYDADKTGLVDYALESAGGQVLSTRCTETYQTRTAQLRIFGIPLWYPSNTPRVAISPAVQPGECWAFQGFPGFLVLKLNSMIYVSGFTVEHIPRSLSPRNVIDSAPKDFTVWGLENENDQEPVLFGKYKYEDNGVALQYFPVTNKNVVRPYDIVELRIETNHGNEVYTCLYRFRVHGSQTG